MFFTQIDTITDVQVGRSLTARKCLSLAEEYLQDHFPGFPVMPGVLMLESLTQACAWLLRTSEDFAYSMVVLHEAKNVKYSGFVEPGQQLTIHVEQKKLDDRFATFKCEGKIGERTAVSGRLVLQRYNLVEQSPTLEIADQNIREESRKAFRLLCSEQSS